TDLDEEDRDVDHIGAPAFAHDLLFVPLRHRSAGGHLLVATDAAFPGVGSNHLPLDVRDAWCAFNDWNGLLYMSHTIDRSRWLAFDISAFVERLHDRASFGRAVVLQRRSDRDFD